MNDQSREGKDSGPSTPAESPPHPEPGQADPLEKPASKTESLRSIFTFLVILGLVFAFLLKFGTDIHEVRYNDLGQFSFEFSQVSEMPNVLVDREVIRNVEAKLGDAYGNDLAEILVNVDSQTLSGHVQDLLVTTNSILEISLYNPLEQQHQELLSSEVIFGGAIIAAEEGASARGLTFNIKTGEVYKNGYRFYPPGVVNLSVDQVAELENGDIWFDLDSLSSCDEVKLGYLCKNKTKEQSMRCVGDHDWVLQATEKTGSLKAARRDVTHVILGIFLLGTVRVIAYLGLFKPLKRIIS